MKIYFSGSIRGGRIDVLIYQRIISHLITHGKVLTAFIGDPDLDTIYGEGKSNKFIWERDVTWVQESDLLVAEVSQTSLGVGYEIAIAHNSHVPVIAFYQQNLVVRVSAMISGDPNVKLFSYASVEETFPIIDQFIHQLSNN